MCIKGSYKSNDVIRYLYMHKSYLLLCAHVCLFSSYRNKTERSFIAVCFLHVFPVIQNAGLVINTDAERPY